MNDRTMTHDEQAMMDSANQEPGGELEAPSTGAGMSTADMARAMEQHGDGNGAARTAAATARVNGERADTSDDRAEPLFPGEEAERFRSRWTNIQTGFVDEPRRSVEQADELVAEVIQRLAQVFADERQKLESQWGQSDAGDTEELRMALRRYRSFFERLLSA